MTIVFLNFSSPKRSKLGIFGPKFKDFCFYTKLCCKTKSRALITKRTAVFQNCFPKHPNKACLVPNSRMLVFAQNFALEKLEGVDCKYDNSF